MLNLNIPQETPLTNENHGVDVYIVIMTDGGNPNTCGVYFSIDRATQYIDDWLSELNEPEPYQLTEVHSGSFWYYRSYYIQKTHLRI